MSTLERRSNTPVVTEEMQRVIRGLALIRQHFGENGIARLKSRVEDLNIRSCYDCALAIASGKEYDDACCNLGLRDISQRAYYGFTTGLGEKPSDSLTITWRQLVKAA